MVGDSLSFSSCPRVKKSNRSNPNRITDETDGQTENAINLPDLSEISEKEK